ncbi:MAG: AAA family ATPase, partial [bacterium]
MTPEPSRPTHPFVTTAPARATLPRLVQDFGARAPFVLLTGDPGSGRSWLAGEWIDRMGGRSAPVVLPDPAPLASGMTDALCALFGGATRHTDSLSERTARMVEAVRESCAEDRVGLVIADDADRLDDAQLLELERLARAVRTADVPFEVMLVGSPLLPLRLASPALSELQAQVSLQVALARLTPEDTREYLLTRLGNDHAQGEGRFSRKACRDIHQEALGLIGTVEAIAAEAIRRAGNSPVSTEHVRQAVRVVRTGRGTEHAPYEPSAREDEVASAEASPAASATTPVKMSASADAAVETTSARASANPRPSARQATTAPAFAPATAPATAPAPAPATAPAPAPAPTNAPADALIETTSARASTNPRASATSNRSQGRDASRPASDTPRDARHDEPDWTPPELDTRPHAERAKDWLSRFGGAGSIRIGVPSAPTASLDEAELLARVNAEDAVAS